MAGKVSKAKAPEQTLEEVRYLHELIEHKTTVRMRLVGDRTGSDEIEGTIEFYDEHFIRLTRESEPNLFLFKHDIKYFYEVPPDAA